MYFRTEVLSPKHRLGICNSFLHNLSMRAATNAAVSSSLGIVTGFKGATLAFPITKALCIGVAQQQVGDCSITDLTCVGKMVQLSRGHSSKVHGLETSADFEVLQQVKLLYPFCPLITTAAGIMSSHPRPFLHRSCKISLAFNTTDTSTPSGS